MTKTKPITNAATEQQVKDYKIVRPLLTAAYNEIKELSKKNKMKILTLKR